MSIHFPKNNHETGRSAEEIAARYMENMGYTVLHRNWRCRLGEVDIIARKGNTTLFIEVKYRSSLIFGHPVEACTQKKLARLTRLATLYQTLHQGGNMSYRIAIVSISGSKPQLRIEIIFHEG